MTDVESGADAKATAPSGLGVNESLTDDDVTDLDDEGNHDGLMDVSILSSSILSSSKVGSWKFGKVPW